MKIFIATPMYGGMCTGQYTSSLLNLVFLLSQRGHSVLYSKLYNESLITRGRNALVNEFLSTDYDGILFIDADQGFEASDVVRMVETGKDLIGGVYPMKAINWETVRMAVKHDKEKLELYTGVFGTNFLPDKDGNYTITLENPHPVDTVSTGMMYLSRKVFDDLAPSAASYLANRENGEIDSKKLVKEFFKTEIDKDGVLLSEDFYICRKWQELGNEVYAAPWVRVTHFGSYEFKGSFAEYVMLKNKDENTVPAPKPKKKSSGR